MKHRISVSGMLLIMTLLALSSSARSVGVEAVPAAPKSDEEIHACIAESFSRGPSLKEQKLSATVRDGVATITGTARNQGSKGAASRIARRCGAREVKNEASVENPTRPKKKVTTPSSSDR